MIGKRTFSALMLTAGLALAAMMPFVIADTIDNPGDFVITATGGYIRVGTQQFTLDPANPPSISGSVDDGGNVVIPITGILFPETVVNVPLIGDVIVRIAPQGDAMGTLNPITGQANFTVSLKIQLVNRLLGANCGIGPVTANVTTGVSGSLMGMPYNMDDGTATYVNNEFSVPRSSGCGLLGGAIDTFAHLPSNPPNNEIVLSVVFDPVFTGS